MKAIVCTRYRKPESLRLQEAAKPTPKPNEVLVRIHASSVNYNILVYTGGKPLFARMRTGLIRPKYKIPGGDIAGSVEAVGGAVTQFKPGYEVFGETDACGYGAYAEYICVPENALVLKPANLTYEEAAAVPQAALVALQALRDKRQIQAGQQVLIYGASGGIGTFAVQIAKAFGAEVTGVCSTRSLDMVRSIGADHAIDYTKEDFAQSGQLYDLIVATAGYRPIEDYARALKPGGTYVVTGCAMKGPKAMRQLMEAGFKGPRLAKATGKKFCILSLKVRQEDLVFLKELIEAGKVKPVIDRSYPLSKAGEALLYYQEGHTRGKIIITM
jgi:NADPH:quinone reductase-like Zn-dependent oxidoreductase